MKKYLNILLVFVMVFALTGCGKKEEVKSKTPNEVLADVLKNDNSLKEAKVDLAAQIKMNYGGMSIDGNFTVGASVVNQDGTIKGLIELGENPIVGKGTFYLDNKSVYYSSKLLDTMYGIETENNDWIIANIDDETDSSINEDFSNLDLKNIDVKIPLGKFVCVTGVSGSGKSSLVNEILYKSVFKNIYPKSKVFPGKCKKIKGIDEIDKVVQISQDPIGRTPRSNPATYVGLFDDIRDLLAQTKEAKIRGFDKGRFSFNVKGGRCEACYGDGVKKIEMHYLPDVYVPCEVCHGTRYNKDTLSITYKGKNIADILKMRVEEAQEFFSNVPKIKNTLDIMMDVGLSYVELGQGAPTLSGGEAGRVKLAKELQKKPTGKSLFILDEPTTGLHIDDIKKLLVILQRIVDNGDTVVVIEHNLDVIKVADYIIDLGPEGGAGGGEIVCTGTPEEVAENPKSYTGQYLKKYLDDKYRV